MKRNMVFALVIVIIAVVAYNLFVTYDNRFPFGRMWETPAIRPHEKPIAYMAPGTIPFTGGELEYRQINGDDILSPIAAEDTSAAVSTGGKLYVHYCIQCHGKYHDGNGTVGQSFAPLPGDLQSQKVQALSAGVLFKEISYGIPGGRQPALATTIDSGDRWRIIAYVKSLGIRP